MLISSKCFKMAAVAAAVVESPNEKQKQTGKARSGQIITISEKI